MEMRKVKGYSLGFIAAVTYGLNPLFALPLISGGMDTSSILFFRYLIGIPIIGLMMFARGKKLSVTFRQLLQLALFGVIVGISSLGLFESYRYMDAGIASTMLFVYPLMVALIMAAFFHERITLLTAVCLAAALAGIGLLYKGENGATLSLTGTVWVMVSALSYAIYIVGVNQTSLSKVPTLTVTFYVLVFGIFVFAADLWAKGTICMPHGIGQWGRLFALGLLPTAVSFLCTTMAIACIGSTPTAILGAMEPLTAVVIGILVFGEQLTVRYATGLVLILTAVTLVILGGSISHPLTAIRRLFPRSRPS